MKVFIIFCLFTFLSSCANRVAHNTKKSNSNEVENLNRNEAIKSQKNSEAFALQSEIYSIDAQISTLDSMIMAAQTRIATQGVNSDGNDAMIFGIQSEISSYEAQKTNLQNRKSFLLMNNPTN